MNLNKPLFFKKNRVKRIYTGGKQFAEFFGDNSTEGFYPEEWVCSTVKALNENSTVFNEGISQLETGEYFSDVLSEHKKELLGENRDNLGILVKFLDSSIRLPLQVHPDKAFSRKYFNSDYGKTESWIIIGTQEDACIYFGFNKKYEVQELRDAFESNDVDKLLSMMNKFPVAVGDVYLIPGRAIHAIGKNCLLIEVQEPTDFTIQPENTCGDYVLSDNEKYVGLKPEEAFECFDMDLFGKENSLERTKCTPKRNGNFESIISYEDTPCFAINKYYINGETITLSAPNIYIVANGKGKVVCEDYSRELKRGDYFFAPYIISNKFNVSGEDLELIQCCLPK